MKFVPRKSVIEAVRLVGLTRRLDGVIVPVFEEPVPEWMRRDMQFGIIGSAYLDPEIPGGGGVRVSRKVPPHTVIVELGDYAVLTEKGLYPMSADDLAALYKPEGSI